MILIAAVLLTSPQDGTPLRSVDTIRCSKVEKSLAHSPNTLFFGDSITQFWSTQPSFYSSSTWVNKGAGGDTAQNGRWRLCRDVIDARPNIVHVMFGTNDIAENAGHSSVAQVFSYITQIVETLRANQIKVVLGSVLPSSQFPWNKELKPATKIRALNLALQSYAAKNCIPYADYWSSMSTQTGALKPQFSKDGVHPNAQGYAVMQPIAQKAIMEVAGSCRIRHG